MRTAPFVLSASLPGGDLVVSYPFDFSKHPLEMKMFSPTPDEKVSRGSLAYADVHPMMMDRSEGRCGGNFLKQGSIINGADWYSFTGGMSDFNYLHSNCFEITVELGCVKFPPEEALYGLWLNNKESLLSFVEMVHRGIKGVVMDKFGKPVKNARILVKGIRHDVTTGEHPPGLPLGPCRTKGPRGWLLAPVGGVLRLSSGQCGLRRPQGPGGWGSSPLRGAPVCLGGWASVRSSEESVAGL
uniref:Peptidase M14 domain-containing protein n=1 Tax=Spermophilus dauricus TaxID=99837 RepID=A0A8C9PVS3_SPEDA